MKKLVVLAAVAMLALPAAALAVTGECSNCHTMHNSFEGAPMAVLADGTADYTPNAVLLLSDCVGCHAQGGAANISTGFGGIDTGNNIPQVYHSNATDLAGGNFAYIEGTLKGTVGANDRKGHNVVDILDADATLTGPPGMGRGAIATILIGSNMHTGSAAVPNTSFTCAGNDGCHGIRNRNAVASTGIADNTETTVNESQATIKIQGLAAMTGSHHGNASGQVDAADFVGQENAGGSYRFLRGVYGFEDNDWQATKAAGDHNEYFGTTANPFTGSCEDCHDGGHGQGPTNNFTAAGHSVSGFCASCHGVFHYDQAPGEATFVRHPTDYVLPTTGEYGAYTAYDFTAPVARQTVPAAASGTVAPGTDLVSCLSCHGAHATDYESMLRFDYSTMLAGGGAATGGCFACHTTKDTGSNP
jgi:hypothetical protein